MRKLYKYGVVSIYHIWKSTSCVYRKSISQALMKKQFKGYIQNLEDGTVEVVAEVFDDDFDTLMTILKEGSPLSSVEDVKYNIIDDAVFHTDGFEIR